MKPIQTYSAKLFSSILVDGGMYCLLNSERRMFTRSPRFHVEWDMNQPARVDEFFCRYLDWHDVIDNEHDCVFYEDWVWKNRTFVTLWSCWIYGDYRVSDEEFGGHTWFGSVVGASPWSLIFFLLFWLNMVFFKFFSFRDWVVWICCVLWVVFWYVHPWIRYTYIARVNKIKKKLCLVTS